MASTTSPKGRDAGGRPALDLRPFTRIGCIGDPTGVRRFLFELAAAARADSRVVAVPGALERLHLDGSGPTPAIDQDLDRVTELVGEEVTSLLVVALARHERRIDGLRAALGAEVAVRALYLDRRHDVEALVSIDERGERTLFVRPEARDRLGDGPGQSGDHDVLFDRPGAPDIGIGLLGTVTMSGLEYPLERHPKLTELVIYLALHPQGATSRSWTAALWPDRRIPGQTVANRLSEARRILGFASDGRPRLRRHGDRHLLVEFGSDWQEFGRLAALSDPASWRAALALVRGRPFEELAQGQWLVFEGFLGEIERTITATGLRLGESALAADDPELCGWAARQALRACPFDERLHRLLMLSADALGDRAGVEATLRQLALLLEIDGDPLAGVHPETARLYARLTAHVVGRA